MGDMTKTAAAKTKNTRKRQLTPELKKLTPLERGAETRSAIKAFIKTYREQYDVAPSLQEIAAGVGLVSHNSVRMHLLTLKSQGEVDWVEGKYRTVRVVA